MLKPVVKWVGGKTQLLPQILPRVPSAYNTYHEPFFGGGAVFLAIAPKSAVINDLNDELMSMYAVLRNNPKELYEKLMSIPTDKETFLNIRALDRSPEFSSLSALDKAARLIYINKTCFNGLYRVNSKGFFNTPYGTPKSRIGVDEQNFFDVSEYLNQSNVKLLSGDYLDAIKHVEPGDFVYLDPPYDIEKGESEFVSYTSDGFGRGDQQKLKSIFDELNDKGVHIMLTNSNTAFMRELYAEYILETVSVRRSINSNGKSRTGFTEIIVRNYGG